MSNLKIIALHKIDGVIYGFVIAICSTVWGSIGTRVQKGIIAWIGVFKHITSRTHSNVTQPFVHGQWERLLCQCVIFAEPQHIITL